MSIDAINSANFCKENTSVNGYNDLIRYRPVFVRKGRGIIEKED